MKSISTIVLMAAVCLAAPALIQSSAIKGHNPTRVEEPVRSSPISGKSLVSPANSNVDKAQKAQVVAAPAVPILESSKKVYNDESIRRSAVIVEQQQAAIKSAQSPIVAHSQPAPVVAAPAVESAPIVEPVKPVVAVPVAPVAEPAPVPVAAPVPVPAPVAAPAPAPVPVAAPIVEQVKPVAKQDDLPPQSDRSVPIKDEVKPVVAAAPVVEPAVVPVVKAESPVVVAPVVEQPQAVVAVAQPAAVAVAPVQPAESQLQARKDEPQPVAPVAPPQQPAEPLHIEVPAPDPGLVLSEPIDSTTKLLIDLDEHVQKFLPAEDKQEPQQPAKEHVLVNGVDYSPVSPVASEPSGKSALPVPYSPSSVASGGSAVVVGADGEPIVPPMPSLEGVEKASSAAAPSSPVSSSAASSSSSSSSQSSATRQAGHHGNQQNQQQVITQLLDQLDSLQNRIQDTINQLVARRRYVMSALLRPMGTYVRRVRTNLERLQNRVNQLSAAAQSVGGGGQGNGNRPGGFVDAAAIETIRRRIDDISKRISDIVNRIRFSLTPTSAPLNSNGRK